MPDGLIVFSNGLFTMATEGPNVFALPTLFTASTKAVIEHLPQHEHQLWETPDTIKQAVLRLMSKRGLITDQNIDKVLSKRMRSIDLATSQVTDECLFKLGCMKFLYKIDLNSFKEPKTDITSAGLISLSLSCPHLQIVYLRRNVNITDEGILALSQNCPMLRELNVGGCHLLTDASLAALGQNSKQLRSLNIISTKVTDNGIHKFCQGECAQKLTELDMTGCQDLTDDSVSLLLQACPLLKILLFCRCPKITENSRIALEERALSRGAAAMKQISWTIY